MLYRQVAALIGAKRSVGLECPDHFSPQSKRIAGGEGVQFGADTLEPAVEETVRRRPSLLLIFFPIKNVLFYEFHFIIRHMVMSSVHVVMSSVGQVFWMLAWFRRPI